MVPEEDGEAGPGDAADQGEGPSIEVVDSEEEGGDFQDRHGPMHRTGRI